jgi:hypothetical protein
METSTVFGFPLGFAFEVHNQVKKGEKTKKKKTPFQLARQCGAHLGPQPVSVRVATASFCGLHTMSRPQTPLME